MSKRKPNSDQPELPIEGAQKPPEAKPKKSPPEKPTETNGHPNGNGHGNGETHVLAESVALPAPVRPFKPGNIELSLHRRVDRGFLDYASYVIRDRAIPNLADGLKP